MKKALTLLLALSMILCAFTGVAETVEDTAAEDATSQIVQADYEQYVNRDVPQTLVVGATTPMSGNFFTDMWGNNTADVDVRTLIHGYGTVAWGRNGDFLIDTTVVAGADREDDADGNRTYTFTIAEDLTYNDGTSITAKDYVFSALLLSSPVLTEFGGVPTALSHLVGYEEFRGGAPFSGVRLIDDYTFSLTIAAENLPYFYELALVNVNPYPMGVIAPGCDVLDGGEGAYIDGPFTQDLMSSTVLAPDEGYLFAPKVTSGPFTLESYTKGNNTAVLVRNEYYKGNYEGWKPFIEKVTFKYADPETMLSALRDGRLDLINKVSSVEALSEAMDMQAANAARVVNYPRSGFSFLSFACELGATQSENVRKAIAMCVNVPSLIEDYVPDFGTSVFGYYGIGQWMASVDQEALTKLALYGYNPDGARELLIADGWIYGADGEEYDPTQGGARYRMNEAGALEELVVSYANAQGNQLSALLARMLAESLPVAGIRLQTTELPFTELLKHYYRQEDRTYNMFGLATNFSMIFDPYYAFSVEDTYQGVFNTTGIKDETLMNLAEDMRKTTAGDRDSYYDKWLKFQERWVEVLPMAPLYSNVYADFARPDLANFASNANFSWASAVVYSYIGQEYQPLELEDGTDFVIE